MTASRCLRTAIATSWLNDWRLPSRFAASKLSAKLCSLRNAKRLWENGGMSDGKRERSVDPSSSAHLLHLRDESPAIDPAEALMKKKSPHIFIACYPGFTSGMITMAWESPLVRMGMAVSVITPYCAECMHRYTMEHQTLCL